ncbi:hypothetical protein P3X46_011514 [Hevea brasiliensis]|uniref:AMP-dependent synthetase/ligase domain-containing protein n=1 Tax=Hevea brasiliensis TaxID=3981 RepID=A0ABQ9M7D6_HEVBR|nr:hypothetical protein P3X46_011514 [Hevea brasiliensis]
MAAGGIYSGANPAAHESEIKKLVQAANAKLIVINDLSYGKGIELPVILRGETRIGSAMNWNELLDAASDLCALPFSLGTTGMSKGVMLTHRNIVASLCSCLFSVDLKWLVAPVEIEAILVAHHSVEDAAKYIN